MDLFSPPSRFVPGIKSRRIRTFHRSLIKSSVVSTGQDGKLWFRTNYTRDVYQENPYVQLLVSSPSYAWIRLSGEAMFENNHAVKEGCMANPIVKGPTTPPKNSFLKYFIWKILTESSPIFPAILPSSSNSASHPAGDGRTPGRFTRLFGKEAA